MEKDFDLTGDHMVHENSTKQKNTAYQNENYNDSFLQKMHKQAGISEKIQRSYCIKLPLAKTFQSNSAA